MIIEYLRNSNFSAFILGFTIIFCFFSAVPPTIPATVMPPISASSSLVISLHILSIFPALIAVRVLAIGSGRVRWWIPTIMAAITRAI